MATWYAQASTNWTDPGVSGPSGGLGIWNDGAGGGGSWGTPTAGDICDTNGFNVTWDSSSDGSTFGNAGTIQGASGTFAWTGSQVTLTANLTITATVVTGGGAGLDVANTVTLALSCDASTAVMVWEVASGGTLDISGGTVQSVQVDAGGTMVMTGGAISTALSVSGNASVSAGSVTGVATASGGALLVFGSTSIVGTVTNNGSLAASDSVGGVTATPNPAVVVPQPARAINTASAYAFPSVGGTLQLAGTYVGPATTDVKSGVHYGPSSSLTGTYTGGAGGGAPVVGSAIVGGCVR